MVKIPALELNGQNWKIYRAKYLEVAATYYCLDVLAGRPDDGTDDWEWCNALICSLFMETVPASIYYHIRLKSAHQIYNYLAKCFRDNDPIEVLCAKKFAARTNEDKRYPSAEAPTSEYAAIGAEWEDLPTKALTRGTEDVNDKIVGRKDPHASFEASAKGTSAESAGTTVLLTGEPHETQNVPQDSLPLTPRPPIEGEPNACKQEATDGVVMAGRTNGMVGMTELRETIADVDEGTTLGGGPVLEACGIDEGDRERNSQLQPQQMNLYDEESCQHDKNANANIPSAHELPLEGEWLVYASGEATNSNGDADASNAAIERVCGPSESRETEDAMEIESEGCGGGTSRRACIDELEMLVECCQQLAGTVGDPGRGLEFADASNESETLVIVSIASESPDGGGIPRVHLGGTRSRAGDANGCGNRADASSCQVDASRGWTDILDVPNGAGTAGMSDGEGAETYLGVRDAKRIVNATDGVGSHANASSGHADVPNVQTNANKPANTPEIVSIPRKRTKPPDLPIGAAKRTPDKPNGCGDHTDGPSVRTDVHSVGTGTQSAANETERVRMRRIGLQTKNSPVENEQPRSDEPDGCRSHADRSSAHTDTRSVGNATETAENEAETVRMRQTDEETQDSPNAREIATPKPTIRWKKVSAGGIDVYVPQNAPIETASRIFVFGRPESGDEAIAPSLEGERAGDGDGDGNGGDGDDGDADGTTSGDGVDSTRVNAAQLATDSQHMRQSRRS